MAKIKLNVKQIDSVVNQIIQESNSILRKTSQFIREDLVKETELTIISFYNHYDPIYYKRHFGFYNVYKPYYSNAHGNIFRGGVELSSDYLDNVYKQPKEEVFDTIFAGFHGPPIGNNINTPRMNPSPIQLIKNKRDYIIDHVQDYINKAR